MDQIDIKLFQLIVNHKSISKASSLLAISQPAASQRLKLLEDELQVNLIIRKKGVRNIKLTNHGISFALLCKKMQNLYSEMIDLKNYDAALPLTIAAPNSVNNYLLLPLFKEIFERETKLRLCIKTHHSAKIYDLIDNHDIDMGFVFYKTNYKNIIFKKILSEKVYMICPLKSIWKNKLIHPEELDPHNELVTEWGQTIEQWHDQCWNSSVVHHIELDTPRLLFNFITKPDHWALCPVSVIKANRLEDTMEIHEFINPPPLRECFMILNKHLSERKSQAIQIFYKYFDPFIAKISFTL